MRAAEAAQDEGGFSEILKQCLLLGQWELGMELTKKFSVTGR
jgi:hypothetical protein